MGYSRHGHENLCCSQCGVHQMSQLFEDAWGYETEESICSACGYRIYVDIGCGGWKDATWSANRIAGVIVIGRQVDGEVITDSVPGSLIGAGAFRQHFKSNGWIVYTTADSIEIISGSPDPTPEYLESIQSAKLLLASIQPFPEQEAA